MVEVGSPLAEGVITAEWDYPALHELWQESDAPLRREMPLLQAGPILATVYGSALSLADAEQLMLDAPSVIVEDDETLEAAITPEIDDDDLDTDLLSSDPQPLPTLHTLLPDATIAQPNDEYTEEGEAVMLDSADEQAALSQVVTGDAMEAELPTEVLEPEPDEDEPIAESDISLPETSEEVGDSEEDGVAPTEIPPHPDPDSTLPEMQVDEPVDSEDLVVESIDAGATNSPEPVEQSKSWWNRFWSGE